jgi:hypothetical protein
VRDDGRGGGLASLLAGRHRVRACGDARRCAATGGGAMGNPARARRPFSCG